MHRLPRPRLFAAFFNPDAVRDCEIQFDAFGRAASKLLQFSHDYRPNFEV
jgi:hypothetical protein